MLYVNKDCIDVFGKKQCLFSSDFSISNVVIDSRNCKNNSLFIAIKGENNDGHKFIESAFENGAVCAICEYIPENLKKNNEYKKYNIILVDNSIKALQDLAIYQRNRLNAKVIGITGNIGKTSVKENIKSVLSGFYKTYATGGNYNNNIGLPLVLANTPIDTEMLILEMGTNHIGEIEFLTKIAKPDIAIITTIVPAHIGNFGSIENIVKAKAEIFKGLSKNGIVILNEENEYFEDLKKIAINEGVIESNIKTIGVKNSDVFIKNYSFNDNYTTKYDVCIERDNIFHCEVNGLSYSKAFNTLFAIEIANIFGLDFKKVAEIIKNIQIVNGRGNIENIEYKGKKIKIINDCYNSSPMALKSAIETLGIIKTQIEEKQEKNRVVAIIGDMLELGEFSQKYHLQIAEEVLKNNIDNVILVGEESKIAFDKLKDDFNKFYFNTTDELLKNIDNIIQNEDIILLKASHGLHFEKIIDYLKQ